MKVIRHLLTAADTLLRYTTIGFVVGLYSIYIYSYFESVTIAKQEINISYLLLLTVVAVIVINIIRKIK